MLLTLASPKPSIQAIFDQKLRPTNMSKIGHFYEQMSTIRALKVYKGREREKKPRSENYSRTKKKRDFYLLREEENRKKACK